MQKKKFWTAALLLALLVFIIPIEHKYDKPLRLFSKTLIPEGLTLSSHYGKKIYFYISDIISLVLLFFALFSLKIPIRRFFGNPLWIVFLCALLSIIGSPFINYPVAYTRLVQLFTPIILFSFLANAMDENTRRRLTQILLWTFVAAGLIQTSIAITQYFHQDILGLHLIGEPKEPVGYFGTCSGKRWIFDSVGSLKNIMRTCGTLPHPNVLGGFLALSLISTYSLFMNTSRWRIFLGATFPFQIFALATTFSRSAIFGFLLATCLWFLAMAFKKGALRERIFNTLAFIVIFSGTATSLLLHDQYVERGGVFNYSNSLAHASDQGRIKSQNTAISIIKNNPLLGVGFDQFSERSPLYSSPDSNPRMGPHNIYLFLACETGLISLFAFLLFIGNLFWATARTEMSLETVTFTSIFTLFVFIGGCDFYPILFQQGKLMFFASAGLLAAHVFIKKEISLPASVKDPDKSQVWKMFDQISPTYDRINRILSLGMDQRWRKKLAKHLPILDKLTILDLATGTGDQALAILESGAKVESITGIDLSAEMLQIAKTKLGSKANLLLADAEKLPFTNGSFNAATFSFGIRNVTDPVTSLKEIYRVLKPSGKCLILEFSLPPRPIRGFYLFYLRYLLPRIGGLLSKKPSAYRYLNQTIEHFPSGKDFSALMQKAGFVSLKRVPMAFGGVTLYVGEKG